MLRHSGIASKLQLQVLFEVFVTFPEMFTGVRDFLVSTSKRSRNFDFKPCYFT